MTRRMWLDAATAPLGDPLTQLVWRVFGLAIYQEFPLQLGWVPFVGLVLLVLGPRLIVLLFTFTVMANFLAGSVHNRVELAIPEEFALFFALPGVAFVFSAWLIARAYREHGEVSQAANREIAALHAGVFQVAALAVMGFAAFHKLNGDFLLADGSCATALVRRLDLAWHIPIREWGLVPSPPQVIAAEGMSVVLLLLYPLFGIAYTVAIMLPLGLFGPTALTTTVFALSLGFLRTDDAAIVMRSFRAHWLLLAIVLGAVGVGAYVLYAGRQPFRIVSYLVMVVALLSGLGAIAADRFRNSPCLLSISRPEVPFASLAGTRATTKVALAGFALLVVVNGLSPYLGLKFRMSFAMFSNLRVDSARWNHLIVPRALQPERDSYVHLTRVELDPAARRAQSRMSRVKHRGLGPALLSPMSLSHRLEQLRRSGGSADLELVYRGESMRFEDVAHDRRIDEFLSPLPRHKLIQSRLVIEGPQVCEH